MTFDMSLMNTQNLTTTSISHECSFQRRRVVFFATLSVGRTHDPRAPVGLFSWKAPRNLKPHRVTSISEDTSQEGQDLRPLFMTGMGR